MRKRIAASLGGVSNISPALIESAVMEHHFAIQGHANLATRAANCPTSHAWLHTTQRNRCSSTQLHGDVIETVVDHSFASGMASKGKRHQPHSQRMTTIPATALPQELATERFLFILTMRKCRSGTMHPDRGCNESLWAAVIVSLGLRWCGLVNHQSRSIRYPAFQQHRDVANGSLRCDPRDRRWFHVQPPRNAKRCPRRG